MAGAAVFRPLSLYGLVELADAVRASGWSSDALLRAVRVGELPAVRIGPARQPVYLFERGDLARLGPPRRRGERRTGRKPAADTPEGRR